MVLKEKTTFTIFGWSFMNIVNIIQLKKFPNKILYYIR